MILPGPWRTRAYCRGKDEDGTIFFIAKGHSVEIAKSLCAQCKVKTECLNYALENKENFGVWGGLSARELRRLRRAKEAKATGRRQTSKRQT